MARIKVNVCGYDIVVEYDYAEAFKGSKTSPPTDAEVDVIEWDFVDDNAKDDCGEEDWLWLLNHVEEYLQGEILYDVIDAEIRNKVQRKRFRRP